MEKKRRRYYFSGDVQGVGFRWTAYHAANRLGVTGWVRNMYDGRVEMEAQGTVYDLEELINDIYNGRYISVENIDVRDIPVIDEREFYIR